MSSGQCTVFLVGVDHRIQYINACCGPEWRARLQAFEDYLAYQAVALDVDLLAEEFNEELLAQNHANACTVRAAACRADRKHLFCEPSTAERNAIGKALLEERESFWLERLKKAGAHRTIFVCGNDHLSTFAARLQAAGYTTVELRRDWGADWAFVQ